MQSHRDCSYLWRVAAASELSSAVVRIHVVPCGCEPGRRLLSSTL
jgi:hypothetical protein